MSSSKISYCDYLRNASLEIGAIRDLYQNASSLPETSEFYSFAISTGPKKIDDWLKKYDSAKPGDFDFIDERTVFLRNALATIKVQAGSNMNYATEELNTLLENIDKKIADEAQCKATTGIGGNRKSHRRKSMRSKRKGSRKSKRRNRRR